MAGEGAPRVVRVFRVLLWIQAAVACLVAAWIVYQGVLFMTTFPKDAGFDPGPDVLITALGQALITGGFALLVALLASRVRRRLTLIAVCVYDGWVVLVTGAGLALTLHPPVSMLGSYTTDLPPLPLEFLPALPVAFRWPSLSLPCCPQPLPITALNTSSDKLTIPDIRRPPPLANSRGLSSPARGGSTLDDQAPPLLSFGTRQLGEDAPQGRRERRLWG